MSRLAFVLIGWLLASLAMGQVVVVDSLPEAGFPIKTPWAFRAGDDPDWRRPDLPDSTWQRIEPTRPVSDLLPLLPNGVGWLRLRLQLKPGLIKQGVVLIWKQTAATELFFNGQRVRQTGVFPANGQPANASSPANEQSVVVVPDATGKLVVAVRFAVDPDMEMGSLNVPTILFWAKLMPGNQPVVESFIIRWQRISAAFVAGLFFILALLHGLFYSYNSTDRTNGSMALACLAFAVAFVGIAVTFGIVDSYRIYVQWALWGTLAYPVGYVALITAIYTIYKKPFGVVYFLVLALIIGCGALLFVNAKTGAYWAEFGPALLATAEGSRITLIKASRQWGEGFISTGLISALILFSVYSIYLFDELAPLRLVALSDFTQQLIYYLAVLFIPVSISLYIARSFVFTQRRMAGQLLEVQRLSKQSFEQEKERQTMLARQKETLEKQVAERTAQLQESLDELRETQNQLVQKEKMASLGELTAGIAHEIQNPLNFVNNFSEVSVDLVNELLEERQRPDTERDLGLEDELLADLSQNLTKISHHGQRASGIVRNMLQHSRTSTGLREPTDLNALADEYLRLSYHGLRAKDKSFNASFNADLDANLPPVNVVGQDIGRVLLNLFNNAFYAVQQRSQQGEANYQPTVTVHTKVVGKQVDIRVRDNGTGIPDEVRNKIFQPFFTTKPTGSGTGLGLSLSYDIITKGHGGTLDVESEAGEFTEFRITLPMQVA
ncbi:sensor histidine kinase [Fibrella sp. GW2-5]